MFYPTEVDIGANLIRISGDRFRVGGAASNLPPFMCGDLPPSRVPSVLSDRKRLLQGMVPVFLILRRMLPVPTFREHLIWSRRKFREY